LLNRLQNGTYRGNGGEADQSTHGRRRIRDSMQRNLKDEECFDRELWRKKRWEVMSSYILSI
jgi:hypothetical protein